MSIYILAALTVETQNGKTLTRAHPNPRTATLLIWGQGPDHCRDWESCRWNIEVFFFWPPYSHCCPASENGWHRIRSHLRIGWLSTNKVATWHIYLGRVILPLSTRMEHVESRGGERDNAMFILCVCLHCKAVKVVQKYTIDESKSKFSHENHKVPFL